MPDTSKSLVPREEEAFMLRNTLILTAILALAVSPGERRTQRGWRACLKRPGAGMPEGFKHRTQAD